MEGVSDASAIFAPGLLEGQVALVTGGGTGLGRAAARELHLCGASVVIAGRRPEVLEDAAAKIGERVTIEVADIREPGEAQRLVGAALERHARLDVLVNNAGGQYFAPAESIEPKGWRAVHRLNVGATLEMCEAAYELAMKPAQSGTIVNVTLSPHNGLVGMVHSSAARAAVDALSRRLAHDWAADGVRVVAAAAGHFETDALEKYPEPIRAGAARSVPLQRLGRPEEHAWLVALLASPLGNALNGSVVTLDGGRDNWFGPWPPPTLIDAAGNVPAEERRAIPK
jgi:citronellol/citronellal dehydrogenase